jgi:hypothetical protein
MAPPDPRVELRVRCRGVKSLSGCRAYSLSVGYTGRSGYQDGTSDQPALSGIGSPDDGAGDVLARRHQPRRLTLFDVGERVSPERRRLTFRSGRSAVLMQHPGGCGDRRLQAFCDGKRFDDRAEQRPRLGTERSP